MKCILAGMVLFMSVLAVDANPTVKLAEAHKLRDQGNHAEAYVVYTNLVLDAQTPPHIGTIALPQAVDCLARLNRYAETDELLEAAVNVHADHWRMLAAVADAYGRLQPQGVIVAGNFERGQHRGGGRMVSAQPRDRVRALRLYARARQLALDANQTGAEVGQLLLTFAQALQPQDPWRLQLLTDLTDPTDRTDPTDPTDPSDPSDPSDLPDYEEGGWGWHHGRGTQGYAPADAEGNPIFFALPDAFAAAANDGERWRALLAEAQRHYSPLASECLQRRAQFAYRLYGVQTLQEFAWFFQRPPSDADTRDAAFALDTLDDGETIARLAGGIKRFALPPDWDFVAMFKTLAEEKANARMAMDRLARIYENRRQYPQAAAVRRRYIDKHGDDRHKTWRKRLDQIVEPWGQLETAPSVPAGTAASVDLRFRNGKRVTFEVHKVKLAPLLEDVRQYLAGNPAALEYDRIRLENIGHRLIHQDSKKHLGEKVADWSESLEPLPDHADRVVTLATPVKEAGAYLLTARMQDGNRSSIMLWIEDTVIAEKHLAGKTLYYVADALTGAPVPGATVDFFGYDRRYENPRGGAKRRLTIETLRVTAKTDADGMVVPDIGKGRFQWLVTATQRDPAAAADEIAYARFAFLNFSRLGWRTTHDPQYSQSKAFVITDRPVYRPGDTAKFKSWVRHAQYDMPPDASRFAGQAFEVTITNPRNEKVLEKTFTADAYGGFDGELELPEGATLGVYRIAIGGQSGQGTFRVEEYKKPEFEVKVDAPSAPQMLGDVIKATVHADYLFGAPVTEATVTIKVTRSEHSTDFYPVGPWDWLYGNGYGWLGYDYDWYPGWRAWGCARPHGLWWPVRRDPPELVAEIEKPIGQDGTVTVSIDTALAKAMHGDQDHRYTISAEVTDASRRTITGSGSVIAARAPFRVFVQLDRGYYHAGATGQATVSLRGADGSPITGTGTATLYRVTYNEATPVETAVEAWPLETDADGQARVQFVAARAGQYRLAAVMTAGTATREGAYIFTVAGQQAEATDFRFNAIELVPEKAAYAAGETVKLRIHTAQADSTVLLFVRPTNGVYLPPQVLRLDGKQTDVEIPVTIKDMPNFFVEAVTISEAEVHSEVREIVVPPVSRVLDVEVLPSDERLQPGAEMRVKLRVRDADGKPFIGSTVLTVYDRAVEYISGGSNVSEIMAYFWKWRRHHRPATRSSVDRRNSNITHPEEDSMQTIGIFGHLLKEDGNGAIGMGSGGVARMKGMRSAGFAAGMAMPMRAEFGAPMAMAAPAADMAMEADASGGEGGAEGEADAVTVRTQFADTAYWAASLETDTNGVCEVAFPMPESLTAWRIKAWTMGPGTRVGEGAADVVTTKNLLLRLQAPRFFVEKDVVTLSANIHNYFETAKSVRALLELDGGVLELLDKQERVVEIPPGGEVRVDWTVRATGEGEAVIRMKALGDTESDAMQLRYPVYVHGMLKTESFSGVLRPEAEEAQITFTVPAERRPDQSRLEVRWSPTLAGAMVDALPYLANYPYGCTEQTLNRFLPTVITQKILQESGVSLDAIREKRTNLNAQEIGDDAERARQWQRLAENPVFDEAEVAKMVSEGVNRLASMQNADGGWGWFYGYGERSYAHTTVVVVRGLLVARANGAAIVPGMIENGLAWLRRYEQEQVDRLEQPEDHKAFKRQADNLDASVHMTLVEGEIRNEAMTDYLYRDRNNLSIYGKCLLGMALWRLEQAEELTMVLRNIEQVLVVDDENQTAWLEMGNGGYWWHWYGSEFEAHALYLKLLAATDPKAEKTAGLVKYLLNNRKHATYWNSTRDTALCVEAMADYLRASGEGKPDMTVELLVDGQPRKQVRVTPETLFDFDNRLVLEGRELTDGAHTLTVKRQGTGPVYFNAYLSNFTLEDPITAAGLEIKIRRQVYRLVRDDRDIDVSGSHGQAVSQRKERYRREALASGATVASGELIEVELEIESKNDYEYIIVEDMKAAGFEAVDQRSGYLPNDMGAYVELRDERVVFFVRRLARGRHSVAYRLRAEIPGRYSALPAKAAAMYAPELKANSDEIKLQVGE